MLETKGEERRGSLVALVALVALSALVALVALAAAEEPRISAGILSSWTS